MKAMILSGGRGKRLRPVTDTIPKPLIKINGKPLIAYFISRNDSSKGLGGMILITGILIIIGAVTVIGMTDLSEADETARNPLMETAPLLIVGGIQMGLGVLKIKKS